MEGGGLNIPAEKRRRTDVFLFDNFIYSSTSKDRSKSSASASASATSDVPEFSESQNHPIRHSPIFFSVRVTASMNFAAVFFLRFSIFFVSIDSSAIIALFG